MPKYVVTHHHDNGETEQWNIESPTYLQAHLDVLEQEGYHIELAPEEKKNIKINAKQDVST